MCSIANPEKTVSTLESYLTYEVKTKTTRPNFPGPDFDVKRRYSDFEWLKKKLEVQYPSSIIPPLPEKYPIRGVLDRFEVFFLNFLPRDGSPKIPWDRNPPF